jgi:ribonuclease-3
MLDKPGLIQRIELTEAAIQYRFSERKYLVEALLHRSYAEKYGIPIDYERLEFLGDALLQSWVSQHLYHQWDSAPGKLSSLRAAMVSRAALSQKGFALGLHRCCLVAPELEGENLPERIPGDVFEALCAAVFLDGGDVALRKFLKFSYKKSQEIKDFVDYKSKVQEFFLKSVKRLPVYDTIQHGAGFRSSIVLNGRVVYGSGSSKKKAEQAAAKELLKQHTE